MNRCRYWVLWAPERGSNCFLLITWPSDRKEKKKKRGHCGSDHTARAGNGQDEGSFVLFSFLSWSGCALTLWLYLKVPSYIHVFFLVHGSSRTPTNLQEMIYLAPCSQPPAKRFWLSSSCQNWCLVGQTKRRCQKIAGMGVSKSLVPFVTSQKASFQRSVS